MLSIYSVQQTVLNLGAALGDVIGVATALGIILRILINFHKLKVLTH